MLAAFLSLLDPLSSLSLIFFLPSTLPAPTPFPTPLAGPLGGRVAQQVL